MVRTRRLLLLVLAASLVAPSAGAQTTSRVIVRARDAGALTLLQPVIQLAGGILGRPLGIINGVVATLPTAAIDLLRINPLVAGISPDRAARGANERTSATVGATAVRNDLGYDGTGIGVAVVDSGITAWHDDLQAGTVLAATGQRVDRFVDFVNGRTLPYDDYGHGTHVAGIIAGNGFDSDGRRTGIAPGAHLTVLKALDASGAGRISDVIAALDYVDSNRFSSNIRIVNLSVGAGVYESYNSDPLTLAARQLVQHGIVVVAAAGNAGKDPTGHVRYGGITAPGNAPWVLTVGASSHMGTIDRVDDTIAAFSSRGPSAIDLIAKPDVVAPGVGIESLSDPDSAFYTSRSAYLLAGTEPTTYLPYLSLNGTSQAAPVVTGTVALMLQANPRLTPTDVKSILQYTAQHYDGYDALTQGAGFLNAKGAVTLARAFTTPLIPVTDDPTWSRQIIRGTQLLTGRLRASWSLLGGTTITWSTTSVKNVVWGLRCGGSDCHETWRPSTAGSASMSADDNDTVVWGNSSNDGDTVVWGNSDADTVVWGNSYNGDEDTVVWGNSCVDSSCQPVVWAPSQP